MACCDLTYMSGRKSTCVRGGLIATSNKKFFEQIKAWLPVYEGFLTYGGMSSKEVEAMAGRVLFIDEGRLVYDGSVKDLTRNGKPLDEHFRQLTAVAEPSAGMTVTACVGAML